MLQSQMEVLNLEEHLISYNTIIPSFLRSFRANMKQPILQLLKNKYLYEGRVRN